MADKLYFAYGSNINLEQMDYRCPDATVVGPVVLENYELLFRRGGFATIEPKKGERVHGLLWSITPECERSLDLYEGYPRFYDISRPSTPSRIKQLWSATRKERTWACRSIARCSMKMICPTISSAAHFLWRV